MMMRINPGSIILFIMKYIKGDCKCFRFVGVFDPKCIISAETNP